MQFNHVVCGGTFDHFHAGHKKLLDACNKQGNKVTIGITSRALTRHKAYLHSLESYKKRESSVLQYSPSSTIYTLLDIYGPTLTDGTIDAIFVTSDTYSGACNINIKRKELGMKALSIVTVPFEMDEKGEKISSERIRHGDIDRQGKRYDTLLFSKDVHYLPESLKEVLRDPLGRVISSFEEITEAELNILRKPPSKEGQFYIITVGDVVTYHLKKRGIIPFVSIIDGFTQRKALPSPYLSSILEKDRLLAPNRKGTIQREAVKVIYSIFNSGHNKAINQLYISGEEDLLTLAVILFAPLKSHIWYGQQGVGIVDVQVTEKIKATVYNLVKQFSG